jgi:carbon storage regulator
MLGRADLLEHPQGKESGTMLVLSRKLDEAIFIDGDIRITVVGIRGNQVRLGIEAPDRVRILREELFDAADLDAGVAKSTEALSIGGKRTGSSSGEPSSAR